MMIFALAALFQVTTAPVSGAQPDASQQQPPAQTETTAQGETTVTVQPPQNQQQARTCRRHAVTGSRVARLVCSNNHVDATLEQDARDGLNRLQSQMPAVGN